VHAHAVWVSNSDQGTIAEIPIRADGSAGAMQPVVTRLAGGVDNFTVLGQQNMILAALDQSSQVVLIRPGADPRTVLTAAHRPCPPPRAHRRGQHGAVPFHPHQAVLPHASLMISHGGHGSVTAALAHGVPLVRVPGAGADQPIVASRVAALGAGTTVTRQAPAGELRDAAVDVMATATFSAAARELARLIEPERGAVDGASALEAWLMSPASGCWRTY